jgi:hypothetical protein
MFMAERGLQRFAAKRIAGLFILQAENIAKWRLFADW